MSETSARPPLPYPPPHSASKTRVNALMPGEGREGAAIYRGMDRAALDAAYNNSAAVPDSAERMARGRERSAAVRANTSPRLLDVAYGSPPRERLGHFPSGAAKPPLIVVLHGG